MAKYGIQTSRVTDEITIGTIDHKSGFFKDRESATDMALVAVGEYVRQNFSTGMVAEFVDADMVLDIRVVSLSDYEAERANDSADPMMTVADVNAARAERADGWDRAHHQFCRATCITHTNPYHTEES